MNLEEYRKLLTGLNNETLNDLLKIIEESKFELYNEVDRYPLTIENSDLRITFFKRMDIDNVEGILHDLLKVVWFKLNVTTN